MFAESVAKAQAVHEVAAQEKQAEGEPVETDYAKRELRQRAATARKAESEGKHVAAYWKEQSHAAVKKATAESEWSANAAKLQAGLERAAAAEASLKERKRCDHLALSQKSTEYIYIHDVTR